MFNKILTLVCVLTFIVALAWFTNIARAQQCVTSGLIAYWPFDEATIKGKTAEDVWGDSDGEIKGEPEVVEGQVKEALRFDNVDNWVLVDSKSINIDYPQITLECWLYVENLAAKSWSRIVSLEEGHGANGASLMASKDPSYGFKGSRRIIRIRHVRKLENPRSDGRGADNSYLLEGMPKDAPNISASFATSYDDCTEGFYNADLEPVDSWRDPVADGDMVMCATTGDLNNDGHNEIVLTTRSGASGVHALRWNPKTRKLEEIWSFLKTPTIRTRAFRGTAIGNFTKHEGREVCFGGARTGLYLVDQHGQLIAHDRTIRDMIQRIDICDNDGDGYDEMIVTSGRDDPGGKVHYSRWTPEDQKFEVMWLANVTPNGRGGNNCYEALYHPNGHPDGGPAIAVSTEREGPREKRAGSLLLLDMKGRELWCYVYNEDEERGGACDFADITGDGVPEIISRYIRKLKEPHELGVVILDNKGRKLARIPNVSACTAGPYVFRPNGPGTKPVYLLAQTNVYEIKVETPEEE